MQSGVTEGQHAAAGPWQRSTIFSLPTPLHASTISDPSLPIALFMQSRISNLILEITVQEILLKFTQECPACLRGQRAGKSTVSVSKNC
jgi:hypothetical protein